MTYTDDHVRTLPLDRGKSELLDEVLGVEPDLVPAVTPRRGRRPWQIMVAAAAAVAVAVAGPVLLLRGGDGKPSPDAPAVDDSRALLTAPGWDLRQVHETTDFRYVDYWRGEENVTLSWTPDEWYAAYSADRDNGVGRRRVGETELVGVKATIWAYTPPETEHEAVTEPRDGWFLTVRGSGIELTEFTSLLAQVVRTDEAAFAAATASDDVAFVDDATIAEMLTRVPKPAGPDGLSQVVFFDGFNSRSDVLAVVAHDVGCAWVDAYAAGRRDDALAALADPASWPLVAGRDDAAELTAVPRAMGRLLARGQGPEAARKGHRC